MILADIFARLAPKPPPPEDDTFPWHLAPSDWDRSIPTLGPLVIQWMIDNLRNDEGEPFRPTAAQSRIICRRYQLRRDGKFRFRRYSLRRVKGWGKSPLLAALCLAEIAGPVQFAGWRPDGAPIGRRRNGAWVVIAGVTEAGTRPIMQSIHALTAGSPLLAEGLDVGQTRVRFGSALIQLATAGAASLEGIRPTFIVADETQHWTPGRHGHALWDVLSRSAAKVPGSFILDASNAHAPAEDSVAERLADAWADMASDDPESIDVIYDDEHGPSDIDLSDLDCVRESLAWLYRDSPWVDIEQILSLLLDSSERPETWRRFYLNLSSSDSDRWANADDLDASVAAEPVRPLAQGDKVVLGCDPAMRRDSTAVVAVRVDDGAPFLIWLGSAPLDTDALNRALDRAFASYHVVGFYADVHGGEALHPLWRTKYAAMVSVKASPTQPIAYDHRAHVREIVREAERMQAEIEGHTFRADASDEGWPLLRRHILAAIAVEIPQGRMYAKPAKGSAHRIDALAALITARIARNHYLAKIGK